MRTSSVNHPANEPMVIIRKWQLEATENDHCAAALLSFFEYWHNIKLAQLEQTHRKHRVEEQHGDTPNDLEVTVMQWHSEEDLSEGILGLYGKSTIAKAVKKLAHLGYISIHKNPNPRYHFDKTRHFVFHPARVRKFFEDRSPENNGTSRKNSLRSIKNSLRSIKNGGTSPEITPGFTPESIDINTAHAQKDSGEDPIPEACRVYHVNFPCEHMHRFVDTVCSTWWGPQENRDTKGLLDEIRSFEINEQLHRYAHLYDDTCFIVAARWFKKHQSDKSKHRLPYFVSCFSSALTQAIAEEPELQAEPGVSFIEAAEPAPEGFFAGVQQVITKGTIRQRATGTSNESS